MKWKGVAGAAKVTQRRGDVAIPDQEAAINPKLTPNER